jgi:hypothetical protein
VNQWADYIIDRWEVGSLDFLFGSLVSRLDCGVMAVSSV